MYEINYCDHAHILYYGCSVEVFTMCRNDFSRVLFRANVEGVVVGRLTSDEAEYRDR